MAPVPWWRVLDAVGGLAEITSQVRRARRSDAGDEPAGEGRSPAAHESRGVPTGVSAGARSAEVGWGLRALEARLMGVVVGALQEAFDRDRARLDLEREQIEAERVRADAALRLELRRQAGDRALAHIRLLSGLAVAVWLVSALLLAGLTGAGDPVPRTFLGIGWVALVGALACGTAAHTRIAGWLAENSDRPEDGLVHVPAGRAGRWLPWLLLGGVVAVAAGLLLAV